MGTGKAGSYSVAIVPWDSPGAAILKAIRFQVFVDEQKVPPELELDEIDGQAVHVLAKDADDAACGTGRLFADPKKPSRAKIGRMAVLKDFRGTGCGGAILTALMDEARRGGYKEVVLSAQCHAVPFYSKFGFEPQGDIYDDAGIPHQEMCFKLS